MTQQFDSGEIEALKYYVYVYTDPRNGNPFYIGKGIGNRAFAHLSEAGESAKVSRIREIRAEGLEPRIELLAFRLDEITAFKVEAAAIDLIGFENLTNKVVGYGARSFGRMSVDEIHGKLASEPIEAFDHDCVLIKINDTYRDSSTQSELALYDATRGTWRVGIENARRAQYALAVFDGIVREVYAIADWFPAGTTMYLDPDRDVDIESRYEFVGRVATDDVRRLYRWKSVSHLYRRGAANPIMYVRPSSEGEPVQDRPAVSVADRSEQSVVIVAARRAYPEYLRSSSYVCQPDRFFRQETTHLGFYADGEIKREIAAIEYTEDAVAITLAEADKRSRSEFAIIRRTAEVIRAHLNTGAATDGDLHKVILLSAPSDAESVLLPQPVRNDTVAASGRTWAWTLGQRYVRLADLARSTRTSELELQSDE